jgi:hypothetical protein
LRLFNAKIPISGAAYGVCRVEFCDKSQNSLLKGLKPDKLLARSIWPELKSHALTALDDVRTCGDIACMAAEKHGARNLKELLARTGLKLDSRGFV